MFDATKGTILRNMVELATPNSGILHIKWTEKPNLALCSDTGGSVWALNFTRRFGIRGCESRCLFSGARGEVCIFEPLFLNGEEHPLQNYVIAAFATLSKIFVIMIKPRLRVIKFYSLPGPYDAAPLLSWQLVLIQLSDSSKVLDPVLAAARGDSLYFYQLAYNNGKIGLTLLRHVKLTCNLLSLHWMGPKTIIYLDSSETLRLVDVRTCKELDSLDVSDFGVVYQSAQFKGLATGGNCSEAFKLIGSYACYNSVVSFGSQLYVLGRQVHAINVRAWSERLLHLTQTQRWDEAIEIAIEGYRNTSGKVKRQQAAKEKILDLIQSYLKETSSTPDLCLEPVINCLIEIEETSLLWGILWERQYSTYQFLDAITKPILQGDISFLSPKVAQELCEFWFNKDPQTLEEIIIKLDWQCLDLHQVVTMTKAKKLYRAQIYINAQVLGDYTVSLIDLVPKISEDTNLGNFLLCYISFSLAGRGYPVGNIPEDKVQNVKHDILRFLMAFSSSTSNNNELPYPYLRAFLEFNTRETLNVIALAFQEKEFSSDLGISQRQRMVNVLLEIITPEHSTNFQRGCLMYFIASQIALNALPHYETLVEQVYNYLTSNVTETIREHWDREQAWLSLLRAGSLNNFSTNEMVEHSRRVNCYRVTEYLLVQQKKYDQILETYLYDSQRHIELIHYLFRYVKDPERAMYEQVKEYIEQLVNINIGAIAKLVVENFPDKISELASKLPKSHQLFVFIDLIAKENVSLDTACTELYIELMCEFNPNEVLDYLKSNSNYNLEHVLDMCRFNDVKPALIYLYERNNDYTSALDIALTQFSLNSSNELVEEPVLEITALCSRFSGSPDDKKEIWFRWLNVLLSRQNSVNLLKSVFHAASTQVDLSTLVQFMITCTSKNGSFGIKDTVMLLNNSKHECIFFQNASNSILQDYQDQFCKARRLAMRGANVRSIKCIVCRRRLDQTNSDIIVLGSCSHALHSTCRDVQIQNLGSFECPRCRGII